ncbi:MAG: cobalt/nickel transport system ATP-binding protein [Halanaerobium sp. 4-GBenrich]|jgi:energy-coupling factor transport system ATP-binding protein|uniref:Energy-coupling factor transporter ATP-binding protein EcfA2 n=1 Tax=Halanaerobium congolense TaxID=54121 RepID=A0A1G6Q335_9FIRM|nr:energy-coupling factor transporter ATPase [Halanaerobium congolense]KXS48387.1 MAG: cobalt/nickel transport system ATP-binding protein [Halanaerobium sp. T82-1]ODS50771.1 MAG: cobalt/nickel transport system ATP-binding protein [Halanaerobium sp. 4-GBenrich]PUU92874.1 MAG: cobalt/nickel transport system ATP-binding protein [Halanaerobium sp.]PTX15530.1 energy-coupling factor transport system ATP-binding protein [Halanaerobium congolense]PXV63892.1 energy-coupling factor transport system ATP-
MLIELINVSHVYQDENNVKALKNINLEINKGEFIGIVGHTGSGKSTLVQLFNGLIIPSSGTVKINGKNITNEKSNLKETRRHVGLVFQYPEHQLFEETVYQDIAFGPKNLGLNKDEIQARVNEVMELVGLDYDEFKARSPFNLSGGQQRKVAIAGVLALKPDVLVLDEPSAGLDPQGRKQLAELLQYLYQELEMTIILISHRMEEIAELSSRVIVMHQGEIVIDDNPVEVFSKEQKLHKLSLDLPQITEILHRLDERGLKVNTSLFSVSEASAEIIKALRSK